MALKDWKRSKKDKNTWHKFNGKTWVSGYIQIYTTAGMYIAKTRQDLQGWIVEIRGSDISPIVKQFKTKAQAFKYAKNYMRKH